MINEKFVLLAAVFNIIGSAGYVIDTLKGKTKPNRMSWLLWAVAPLIAFAAEIGQHVGLVALMTFMVGFGPLVVFFASFINRKSYWCITKLDIVCGVLSVVALLLWRVTGTGNVAITLSIAADLLAGVPTLIKSYVDPASENYQAFGYGALSAAITMLTIKHITFVNFGFPLYIFAICVVLFVLIRFKVGVRNKPLATA